jgi:hypothetical protein
MKKAKIALSLFAVVALVSTTLAFKSSVRSNATFYTTDVQDATDGAALQHAITTVQSAGTQLWYTTIQGNAASTQAYITTSAL